MTRTAKQYSPKSIKTIVLFDKKDVPSKQNIVSDYLGIQVPNV
jgi:hypoxanthine-guanine phosphoribosyltransferase